MRGMRVFFALAIIFSSAVTVTGATIQRELPLIFEANEGQASADVKFLSRGAGYSLFLSSTEAVLTLKDAPRVIRMEFIGANRHASIAGLEPLAARANYFIGDDPLRWRTDVPTYGRVESRDLYPGVSLVYYGRQGELEYDLVVQPGADPNRIALRLRGGDTLKVNQEGELVQRVGQRELIFHPPLAYQEVDGQRLVVPARYRLKRNVVAFDLGAYDRTRALVIDPILTYSTYLGGAFPDEGRDITADSAGNAYVVGYATFGGIPTTPGSAQPLPGGEADAFVTKLAPDGTVVYSTYIGGSSSDSGTAIAVDATGAAYVTGFSASPNFPLANAYQSTFTGAGAWFVTKLSPSGSSLIYSTYLGGSNSNFVGSSAWGIAVDSSGSAYVGGGAHSASFPTRNPFQPAFGGGSAGDAYVAKFNPAGSDLIYASYLGGSSHDLVLGIAVDSVGNAYVTGFTASPNFPTVNPIQATYGSVVGAYNAFVTKIAATGMTMSYSTYLGGSTDDRGFGIAVDAAGAAVVVGAASSADFPVANALQSVAAGGGDAFVTKLHTTGSLIYSTFLGGSGNEGAYAVALDSAGDLHITGVTASANFPRVNPMQGGLTGPYDAFVTNLNGAGTTIVFSTHLGGSGGEIGQAIDVDAGGFLHLTGQTNSTDFPTLNAVQSTFGGSIRDAFVARINPAGSAPDADLSIAKSDGPDPVTAHGDLTYTLAVTNSGPAVAHGVTVSDVLPAGVVFVSASSTQGSCNGTSTILCAVGTLTSGGTATVTIVVRPTAEGQITNVASVSAHEVDLDPADNTANATTTVNRPDLYSAKGQRADVNDFLAFAAPVQATTNLAAGSTSFDVIIYYGPTISGASFSATLNGAPFAGFTPVAGTNQRVTIPLSSGRNVLLLIVNGVRTDGRTATERDRLTFVVP